MKAWIIKLFGRIGDLVIKIISVKVVAAVVITGYALMMKMGDAFSLSIVAVAWLGVVGIRYAEKLMHIVRGN